MFKLTSLVLIAGVFAACNSEKNGREAERAADRVNDKTNEVKEEAKELGEASREVRNDLTAKVADNVGNVAEETKDLAKSAKDLDEAQNEFAYQKLVRIQTLRTVHAIKASQPNLINTVITALPYVAADRARTSEKLQVLKMRIEESARLIQGLESVDAAGWVTREHEAADAMNRVEDARADAWDALEDAKLVDGRTSMQ